MIWVLFLAVWFVAAYAIFLLGVHVGRDEQRRAMTLPEDTARRYRDSEPRWRT